MKRMSIMALILLACSSAFVVPPADAGSFNVYRGQIALKELGYKPGPIDGIMGPATHEAVRRFQRDHGLVATGEFNEATVIQLRRRTQKSNRR